MLNTLVDKSHPPRKKCTGKKFIKFKDDDIWLGYLFQWFISIKKKNITSKNYQVKTYKNLIEG